MKPILYILINIILFVGFSENIQAQEVENPPEELADKTWYLTKMIIDEEEMLFTPNEEVQQSIFITWPISENPIHVEVAHCDQGASEIYLIEEDQFYFDLFIYLASENDWWCNTEENVDFHDIYINKFWNNYDLYLEDESSYPFHFYYMINQLQNHQELIVTNDAGDKAYFQNIELSVQDNEKSSLTFYPNPAQEEIYIENLTATAEIEIYNISGKKLLQQQVNSSTESINISNLSAGIYLYSFVQNGKKIKTGKLVKE